MRFGRNILTDLKFITNNLTVQKCPKCLYVGYTGYGNLGDEALKEAIFELFRSKCHFSESRGFLIRLLEKFGFIRFQAFMLGGGTLVLRSEDMLSRLSDESINKKIIFGTGVANHIFWKDIPANYGDPQEWMDVLNAVEFIGVRGPISRQILIERGIRREVPVMGDPVLYFTRKITGPKQRRKRLGVNVGTAQGGKHKDLLWGRDELGFLGRFAEFVRVMVAEGWEVEFIPVCKEDLEAINYVIDRSGCRKKITTFKNFLSVQATLDRLETFDVFIGEKLHSVVLAYCANTPAVMVEYRPKCRDFMCSIGMQDFNIRTDEFTADKGKLLLERLCADLEQIRNRTNKVCLEYKDKLIQASKDVAQMIGGKT